MQCSGRSTRSASLTATAKFCPLPVAQSARCLQRHSISTKRNLKALSRHRKQKTINSQASSSSQASVTLRAPSSAQQSAPKQQALEVPRSLLIAIDYTSDAEQALQWALDFVVKPGDKVHLVHVICNPRANTDGSAAGAGYNRSSSFQEVQEMKAFVKRLEQAELDKIQQRFQKRLQAAGVSYEVNLPVQKGQKSAQAIGEVLCQTAADLDAAVMLIASHGTGVLADYGSVANYCSQNSRAPVLMIPPNVAALKTHQPGNLMVVALADMAGLQKVASFTLNNLFQPGDTIHTTFVEDTANSEEAVPSQHGLSDQMEEAAKEWFTAGPQDKVNFEINLMVAQGPLESSDLDLGEEICAKADKLEARAVVLLHHGKSLMKEMVFGSITSFATRNCRRPLVVYYD
ncbi:TPA: hypothetical protein ACH3X2_012498 [Trebouxia sp. C0005]|nr:MAG: hypothetical protein FRX49_05520 [Trebouxia sp. A1-2]